MIIFLYGQDTYRLRRKLNEIIEHYKKVHKSGLNLKYFEGKELTFQDFKDAIQTTSMFKEKKLIILLNAFSNQEFKENFLKNSKKLVSLKDIILFYEENKIPPTDPLFKFLKKQAKIQEFKLLEGQRLKNWLRKELENSQIKIEPRAAEKLITFVGNDLWQFSNEIKKLAGYKKNEKIEEKDVDLLIRPKIETDIFKTIDAVSLGNKRQALNLMHDHLERGDSPLYLLSMINFQFRNILTVKAGSFGFRMHPYVIRKSQQQAKRFSLEELKKIYQKIFQADLEIKTGQIEPRIALDLLITEICSTTS